MRNNEYRRLHEACLAMAKQATEQKMRDRWSAMAEAWLKRVTELDGRLHRHKASLRAAGAVAPADAATRLRGP